MSVIAIKFKVWAAHVLCLGKEIELGSKSNEEKSIISKLGISESFSESELFIISLSLSESLLIILK